MHCRLKRHPSVGNYKMHVHAMYCPTAWLDLWIYSRQMQMQGADFIECDAVLTKDCEFICRHEPLLSNTTNAGTPSYQTTV